MNDLTHLEQIMLAGLDAREEVIRRRYLTPLRADAAAVHTAIEERAGLPIGAIGSTHRIDRTTWEIVTITRTEQED